MLCQVYCSDSRRQSWSWVALVPVLRLNLVPDVLQIGPTLKKTKTQRDNSGVVRVGREKKEVDNERKRIGAV